MSYIILSGGKLPEGTAVTLASIIIVITILLTALVMVAVLLE